MAKTSTWSFKKDEDGDEPFWTLTSGKKRIVIRGEAGLDDETMGQLANEAIDLLEGHDDKESEE